MSLVKNAQNRHKDPAATAARAAAPTATAAAPAVASAHGNAAQQERVHRDRHSLGGMQSVETGDGGVHVRLLDMESEGTTGSATGPHIDLSAGQVNRREHTGEARRWGIRGGAGLASAEGGTTNHGGDVDTPSVGFEATAGDDGATLGVGANLLSGSGHTTIPIGDSDNRVRGGVGAGEGAAVRWHWGDTEGDGLRDIGVGGDVGPWTGDVTTEALHSWWNELTD